MLSRFFALPHVHIVQELTAESDAIQPIDMTFGTVLICCLRTNYHFFLFFLFLGGAMITLVTRQIAIITCNLYRKCQLVCKFSLTTNPAVVKLAKV